MAASDNSTLSKNEIEPSKQITTTIVNGETTEPTKGEAKEEQAAESMCKEHTWRRMLTQAKTFSKSTSKFLINPTRSRSWSLPKNKCKTFDNR